MIKAGIMSVALACIMPGIARAQWVVVSPSADAISISSLAKEALTEVHTAQEVINTAQTVIQVTGVLNAAAHGNIMGLTTLAPLLTSEANPFGGVGGGDNSAALHDLMTLGTATASLGGRTLSLVQQAKYATTTYSTAGTDFSAISIARQAAALAGQLGASQASLSSSSTRLTSLPALLRNSENSADIKSSMDAGNTIAGQQLTQTAQTNQLLAMQIQQRANEANERNLAEQNWRMQTDQLGASAANAAAAARAGTIRFITP